MMAIIFLLFGGRMRSSSMVDSISFSAPAGLTGSLVMYLVLSFLSSRSLCLERSQGTVCGSMAI